MGDLNSADDIFRAAFKDQQGGRRKQAILLYEELLRIVPNHRQGSFNLAYALLHGSTREEWARSAKLFRKVLEIDRTYIESIHRLATAYWKLGDIEQAVKYDKIYLERGVHPKLKDLSEQRLATANESK